MAQVLVEIPDDYDVDPQEFALFLDRMMQVRPSQRAEIAGYLSVAAEDTAWPHDGRVGVVGTIGVGCLAVARMLTNGILPVSCEADVVLLDTARQIVGDLR